MSYAGASERRFAIPGFTVVELLVVIFIIALVAGLLIPTLSTSSGRSLDGAARQFAADLQNARLIAIAERTRTRVLLPQASANFVNGATNPPTNLSSRGYLITSEKKTETLWKQRGKWNRLPQGIAVEQIILPSPTPTPTPVSIDVTGTGSTSYTYSGPYIEFLANGSSSLDPLASPAIAVTLADGFVDSSETFRAKNRGLTSTITVEASSGAVSLK